MLKTGRAGAGPSNACQWEKRWRDEVLRVRYMRSGSSPDGIHEILQHREQVSGGADQLLPVIPSRKCADIGRVARGTGRKFEIAALLVQIFLPVPFERRLDDEVVEP